MNKELKSYILKFNELIFFLHQSDLKAFNFIIPVIFSFLSSLFEGIMFVLLLPFIQGVLKGDYTFIVKLIKNKAPFIHWETFFPNNSTIFAVLLLLILISVILKCFFSYFSSIVISFIGCQFSNNLRKKIYQRYLSFGKSFFDKNNFGHLHQILIGCTSHIAGDVADIQGILSGLFNVILYVVIMFVLFPFLSFCVFLVLPILYFISNLFNVFIRKDSEEFIRNSSEFSGTIQNALQCIPLIKSCSSEQIEKEWFNCSSDLVAVHQHNINKKRQLIGPLQEIVSMAALLLLIAFIACLVSPGKSDTVARYVVFLLMLRRVMSNFGVFSLITSFLASISGSINQIKWVFDDKDKFFIESGRQSFSGINHSIIFNNIFFEYPPTNEKSRPILKDFNLTIHKGEMLAVVGASGAGKTTLISLLLRFYNPIKGNILLDDIDICEYSLESLHDQMALVTQETYLFNASFKENLTYGMRNHPSQNEIDQVLEQSCLTELVKSLPQRLDTKLGDRGVNLSGGERQRLSIARALLRKSEILIFDEATSSLDSITEGLIQNNLREFTKDKTSIIIAHRLSTMRNADRVIVLEGGEIVEQGNIDFLLKQHGKFYQYWSHQKFLFT